MKSWVFLRCGEIRWKLIFSHIHTSIRLKFEIYLTSRKKANYKQRKFISLSSFRINWTFHYKSTTRMRREPFIISPQTANNLYALCVVRYSNSKLMLHVKVFFSRSQISNWTLSFRQWFTWTRHFFLWWGISRRPPPTLSLIIKKNIFGFDKDRMRWQKFSLEMRFLCILKWFERGRMSEKHTTKAKWKIGMVAGGDMTKRSWNSRFRPAWLILLPRMKPKAEKIRWTWNERAATWTICETIYITFP